MSQNKIKNNSNDKEYFVLTPQIVWAASRDPYDYTLWNVIKMIAGDNGECFLSTEDLAILSMMSAGKVSDCRKYLISQGLLEGEVRQDPGYPQPVWHLTIPDLWKANVEWREQNAPLKQRIEFKKEQRETLRSTRKTAKHNSLHQVKPSSGEERPSPDEERPSPDETKNNHQENQKEQPHDANENFSDSDDDFSDITDPLPQKERKRLTPDELPVYAAAKRNEKLAEKPADSKTLKTLSKYGGPPIGAAFLDAMSTVVNDYPNFEGEYAEALCAFFAVTGSRPPNTGNKEAKSKQRQWYNAFENHFSLFENRRGANPEPNSPSYLAALYIIAIRLYEAKLGMAIINSPATLTNFMAIAHQKIQDAKSIPDTIKELLAFQKEVIHE